MFPSPEIFIELVSGKFLYSVEIVRLWIDNFLISHNA